MARGAPIHLLPRTQAPRRRPPSSPRSCRSSGPELQVPSPAEPPGPRAPPASPNGPAPARRTAGSRREAPSPNGSPQAPAASTVRPPPARARESRLQLFLRAPFVSSASCPRALPRPPWRAPGPAALPGPGRLQRGSLLGRLWRRRRQRRRRLRLEFRGAHHALAGSARPSPSLASPRLLRRASPSRLALPWRWPPETSRNPCVCLVNFTERVFNRQDHCRKNPGRLPKLPNVIWNQGAVASCNKRIGKSDDDDDDDDSVRPNEDCSLLDWVLSPMIWVLAKT
ncbi:uncharacterized protein PHA67_018374 [Liasis olivaceus]